MCLFQNKTRPKSQTKIPCEKSIIKDHVKMKASDLPSRRPNLTVGDRTAINSGLTVLTEPPLSAV